MNETTELFRPVGKVSLISYNGAATLSPRYRITRLPEFSGFASKVDLGVVTKFVFSSCDCSENKTVFLNTQLPPSAFAEEKRTDFQRINRRSSEAD